MRNHLGLLSVASLALGGLALTSTTRADVDWLGRPPHRIIAAADKVKTGQPDKTELAKQAPKPEQPQDAATEAAQTCDKCGLQEASPEVAGVDATAE